MQISRKANLSLRSLSRILDAGRIGICHSGPTLRVNKERLTVSLFKGAQGGFAGVAKRIRVLTQSVQIFHTLIEFDALGCIVAVKPTKGDALLFFSLHPDASTDDLSLHGGCPVEQGEKWSATKWMHVASFDRPKVSCPRYFCSKTFSKVRQQWSNLRSCFKSTLKKTKCGSESLCV